MKSRDSNTSTRPRPGRFEGRRHTNASIMSEVSENDSYNPNYTRHNVKQLDGAVRYKFKMELEKSVYKSRMSQQSNLAYSKDEYWDY